MTLGQKFAGGILDAEYRNVKNSKGCLRSEGSLKSEGSLRLEGSLRCPLLNTLVEKYIETVAAVRRQVLSCVNIHLITYLKASSAVCLATPRHSDCGS